MPGNPESLEQFFLDIPYEKVLTKAFYMQPGSQYGIDFWREQEERWKQYWELNQNNINNQSYIIFKGSFGVLRQNWDKPAFWRKENLETNEQTYERMGIEPPMPHDSAATLCKFKEGDIIQSHISDEVQTIINITAEGYELEDGCIVEFDKEKYWMKIDERPDEADGDEVEVDTKDSLGVPEAEEKKNNGGSLLEGFSLVDTSNGHSKRMHTNDVSINLRNGGYRITFSVKKSDELRKGSYKYVKFLTNPQTREVALIFNNTNGCAVNIKKKTGSEVKNITINSKDIVEHIHRFYGMKKVDDYFTLEITTTINQEGSHIFKLKLKE